MPTSHPMGGRGGNFFKHKQNITALNHGCVAAVLKPILLPTMLSGCSWLPLLCRFSTSFSTLYTVHLVAVRIAAPHSKERTIGWKVRSLSITRYWTILAEFEHLPEFLWVPVNLALNGLCGSTLLSKLSKRPKYREEAVSIIKEAKGKGSFHADKAYSPKEVRTQSTSVNEEKQNTREESILHNLLRRGLNFLLVPQSTSHTYEAYSTDNEHETEH
ncbi:hypothetical protein B0H13DRAFT_1895127 [Mycena leptocephala]|nr:hypothetical protein B0H13DRAFT_1895127 [Mycena leptocephala]